MGQKNSDCAAADEFWSQNDAGDIPKLRGGRVKGAHSSSAYFGFLESGCGQEAGATSGQRPNADSTHHAAPKKERMKSERKREPPILELFVSNGRLSVSFPVDRPEIFEFSE